MAEQFIYMYPATGLGVYVTECNRIGVYSAALIVDVDHKHHCVRATFPSQQAREIASTLLEGVLNTLWENANGRP